ncbi:glycosyltransferase involved in cell wall biosynthesis [Chryseobacterium sp. SORGH_AS 447]|uniref:glycosyltransferase family 4 protein n=1 Tax=Chryseobacterium sp. SORGH_AS_0447 TaxID=3041769 RepID=UPI00278A1D29|nr:glycosyltransferase family 4 protein [Chryseobacterium sp. SORGH_AS_0447]MDQ1161019.1 glycosyltransferase involved in cell wall biosynthesis [Chryseobacterium sp. SORGH_AS_0447]
MTNLVYLIPAMYNPGGMERILTEKINYLVNNYKYNIFLITTDQGDSKFFFKLSDKVTVLNWDIGFDQSYGLPLITKFREIRKKLKNYKCRLNQFLQDENIDICISTGGKELEFLHKLKVTCKFIFECHFSKDYRRQFLMSRNPSLKSSLIGWFRNQQMKSQTKRLDKVVVLTNNDLHDWKKSHTNIQRIPNFCSFTSEQLPIYKRKRAIAVGKLDAQKGFDMLIDSWAINKRQLKEWTLDIFGQGEWRDFLAQKIIDYKLEKNIYLRGVTNDIRTELQNSSMFLFSSRYEGFGLAVVEAMTVGLPVISFDCPQGPSEMVNSDNGFLVPLGNIEEFSNRIVELSRNSEIRENLGLQSIVKSTQYSKEYIMEDWNKLFLNVIKA